jgi:hypothetical protein
MAVLGAQTVVGVFASPAAAEEARGALLEAGIPESRIALSAMLTGDDIAAEAPGQSYENQPGQPSDESESARYGESVRTGACVLSVFTRSEEEKQYVEQLLLRNRAHSTTIRP